MKDDCVYYISEHRRSYDNELETENIIHENADFTLIPFSVTRFNAIEAQRILEAKGYKINIIHQLWIKPFELKNNWLKAINNSMYGGLVLDDDYEEGVASSIAHTIMIKSEKKIYTQCIRPRSAGFHEKVDNLPPSVNEIINNVEAIIKNGK